MKSADVKTEQDINKLLSELEMRKFTHISRRARREFINSLMTLGVLLLIVVLGAAYPFIRESIALSIREILRDIVNWYILLGLIIVQIIKRIVLYRTR